MHLSSPVYSHETPITHTHKHTRTHTHSIQFIITSHLNANLTKPNSNQRQISINQLIFLFTFKMPSHSKTTIPGLHSNGINSIELFSPQAIYSCNDTTIQLNDLASHTRHTLYSSQTKHKTSDEISCLKCFSLNQESTEQQPDYLFASNNEFLQLFDLRTAKQINKYKFCKETVNSVEVNKARNCIVCCDDSGEDSLLFTSLMSWVLFLLQLS
jgi:hypothetical protein